MTGAKILDLKITQGKIRKLILEEKTTFTVESKIKNDVEYIDVEVEFTVGGVILDRDEGILKMYVDIHDIEPMNEHTKSGPIMEIIEGHILAEMPFLIKDTYALSLDELCIGKLKKKNRERYFRDDLRRVTTDNYLTKDETVIVLKEYLEDCLPETSFDSLEAVGREKKEVVKEKGPEIQIVGDGAAPCPLCKGLLSYYTVKKLYYKILDGYY